VEVGFGSSDRAGPRRSLLGIGAHLLVGLVRSIALLRRREFEFDVSVLEVEFLQRRELERDASLAFTCFPGDGTLGGESVSGVRYCGVRTTPLRTAETCLRPNAAIGQNGVAPMTNVIELLMLRPDLEAANPELPDGIRLVDFREGDAGLWVGIQADTGVYRSVSKRLFRAQFGDRVADHASRICVCYRDDDPIGTAAAWTPHDGAPDGAGRLHWVAVVPREQGRGVGTLLVLETLRRLRSLGYSSAYLTTGSENTGAIRLYRRLGFRAAPRSEEEQRAWERISRRAGSDPS